MFFTTNQWAILALVLVLGWVLGLASRSGGGRWKRQAEEERVRRETAEERIPALTARIAELERRDVTAPAVVHEPIITPTENLATDGRPNPPVI